MRARGPMWVSPLCCLSVVSLEESSQRNNPRRKGSVLQELAGVFLTGTVCMQPPRFPRMSFCALSGRKRKCGRVRGGMCSGAARCLGLSWPRTSQRPGPPWRGCWDGESSFLPGKRRGQMWLNAGEAAIPKQGGQELKASVPSFHPCPGFA